LKHHFHVSECGGRLHRISARFMGRRSAPGIFVLHERALQSGLDWNGSM
jgi:hypothetical protein